MTRRPLQHDHRLPEALALLALTGPCSVDYLRERLGVPWRGMMAQIRASSQIELYWHQRRRWLRLRP